MLEFVDEVVGIDIPADLHDFFVRNVLLPQDDVAADSTREEENVLQHLAEVTAEGGNLDFADVDAVDQNLALLELVVAADEGEDGALARAGRSDEGHGLAGLHMEGNALQHPLARDVAEPDVPELDVALHFVQLDGIGGVHHLGLDVHDGEDLLRRRQRRLQPVELLGEVLDRGEELGDIHIKGDDGAAGNGLPEEGDMVQMAHAAKIEQAEDRADIQHIHQRTEDAEDEDLLLRGLGEGLALLAELLHLLVLAAKDLGDFDAGEILGEVGVDVGGRVLDLAVSAARELAEDDREQEDEGYEAKHHQGQLVVQEEHRHQNAQNDEGVLGEVDEEVREHHRDGVGVVGHAGDELAHRDVVQLAVGEAFNVGEKVFTQIGDDALAHTLQNDGLQIGAGHREDQHTRVHGHTDIEAFQFEIAYHKLFDVAHDEGRRDVVGDGEEDEKAHDDELLEVGFGVAEEAAQDLAVGHAALEAHSRFLVFDAGVGDEQQHRHGADNAAYEKKRIQTHHALPPPTSSSSFCKSTILWYSGQDA